MAKVLVTGANGMLGQDICPILEQNGYEVFKTDISLPCQREGDHVSGGGISIRYHQYYYKPLQSYYQYLNL